MKIMKFILITCLLTVAGLYCHAEIPPLEPSVEDPSTGLNVQPGFEVELIYKVDKRKFGSWIAMAFDEKGCLLYQTKEVLAHFGFKFLSQVRPLTRARLRS